MKRTKSQNRRKAPPEPESYFYVGNPNFPGPAFQWVNQSLLTTSHHGVVRPDMTYPIPHSPFQTHGVITQRDQDYMLTKDVYPDGMTTYALSDHSSRSPMHLFSSESALQTFINSRPGRDWWARHYGLVDPMRQQPGVAPSYHPYNVDQSKKRENVL